MMFHFIVILTPGPCLSPCLMIFTKILKNIIGIELMIRIIKIFWMENTFDNLKWVFFIFLNLVEDSLIRWAVSVQYGKNILLFDAMLLLFKASTTIYHLSDTTAKSLHIETFCLPRGLINWSQSSEIKYYIYYYTQNYHIFFVPQNLGMIFVITKLKLKVIYNFLIYVFDSVCSLDKSPNFKVLLVRNYHKLLMVEPVIFLILY